MRARIAALLLTLATGCVVTAPSNPTLYQIEPKGLAQLRGGQVVALQNGFPGAAKVNVRLRSTTLEIDQREFTETAIAMLGRALQSRGIDTAGKDEKQVVVWVRMAGMLVQIRPPIVQATARVVVHARFADGTETSIRAENMSPGGYGRAIDGAILFALNELVEDEKFVAYMNR